MSRKGRAIRILLCLSLCFFVGCGKNAEDGRTESGRGAYIDGKENRETEQTMADQERQETQKTGERESTKRKAQTWTEEGDASEIILTADQIREKNRISFSMPGNGMVDLSAFAPQSAEEIRCMVEAYPIPEASYYDGNVRTEEDERQLLASRNLEQLKEPWTVRYGILTENAAVRSFPTQKAMTKTGKPDDFDYIQESMLSVGEGVAVCHQTADQEYSFVQGYQYQGWILTASIGFCGREEMLEFLRGDPVVITDACLHVKGQTLRMGTVFPYAGETENGYLVDFPVRGEDGTLMLEEEEILGTSASAGYLDYTREALLNQAYKMVGQPYGWGDTGERMDCSSTMNCIFRSFGIQMPRNTSKLTRFDAKVTDLSSMDAEEKIETIKEGGSGSMILLPGHVAMYVGEEENTPRILHNVTGYSVDGGTVGQVMECRVTPMEIYSTGGIWYPELFTALVEVE